ncbi:GNAT family N-acetyltransferase [Streptomyces capparidis]
MTTTLRPGGPERHEPDGTRARTFAVCVNSRPVGEITVSCRERGGVRTGRLSGLRVDEPERRRGRGTVAALAAEEVLRQWGCDRVDIAVPEGGEQALRLASALGYTERSLTMASWLESRWDHTEPPPLPPGCSVHPLADAEYDAWLAVQQEGYIRELVAAGMTEEQARAKSDADHRASLPQGPHTPGAVLRVLRAHGEPVGTLWVGLRGPDRPQQAWVFSVEVEPPHRGRGHGRALMRLAEAECRAAGVFELGLNVFTANTAARRLYTSLGYQVTMHHLGKNLL